MKVTPLRRQSPKPVALIVPGWRHLTALTADGERVAAGPQRCWNLLKELEGHVTYTAGSLQPLLYTTGATAWSADVWRGRITTMHLAGTTLKVRSLRRTLEALSPPPEQFAALMEVVGWAADQGVRAGSVSAMAWALWRTTLSSELSLGFDSKAGRAAFYGGRQESARPHTFTDQVSLDISSAYPHAMASRPYAGLMREVSATTSLDPEVAGIARASVTMPDDLKYPALPVRVTPEMIQWRWGELHGAWPWSELHAARELGASVTVERCWAPATTVEPFTAWWELMQQARAAVSPGASTLVKAMTNTLFGCFAMNGDDRASIVWTDDSGDTPQRVREPAKMVPQANTVHLAAETTARVRVRMLLEGLYGDSDDPCHIDTDGIIVSAASAQRRRLGEGPGQWRRKNTMVRVEVKGPQMYRWHDGKEWHYVVSGVAANRAPHLFTELPSFQLAISGLDTVIPSGHWLSPHQVGLYEMAAAKLERQVYGERLAV